MINGKSLIMSWKRITDYWAEWKIEEGRRGNIGLSFGESEFCTICPTRTSYPY